MFHTGITSAHPEKYKSVVVRLGGFHICENFMGCIGSFMKDSGIEEILTESGAFQRGTVNKIMAGKDYYKMIRCHSLLGEAIIGMLWDAFEKWCLLSAEMDKISNINECLHNL